MTDRRLLPLVLLLGLLILPGCGIMDYFLLEPPEDTAQELFEAGVDAMHEEKYSAAAEYFTKLKDRYPFSPYTPQAEIGLGDAYFMDEEWMKAVEAYKEFEALHPSHKEIPYVLYQIGVSLHNSFDSIDLPMTHVGEALEYFRRVEEAYPGTKYAEAASKYIIKCRTLMAEHELFVADFYWRTDRYVSAWKRYQYVAENFGELPEIKAYAQKRAGFSYYEYQKTRSTEERDRMHGTWKDWFDWL